MDHPIIMKNFFEHQEEARARTRWAVLGFGLAVAGVVLALMAIAGVALVSVQEGVEAVPWTDHLPAMLTVGGIALVVIVVSTFVRLLQMRAGPEAVMQRLGGWRVPAQTDDPEQRRLLNLVEEMSIASGVPVPEVYVLNEEGINACAVGLDVNRAAVGVTRGAMESLKREELQGVIAHEFSHILHGDMRLNTKLIAWLAGLFTLSELGRILVYSVGNSRSRSRNSKDNGGGAMVFLSLGAAIWILGGLGVFFGKLLQAAVSRQREFLADASAVQFTRNPEGLGNALRRLGPHASHGRIARPSAQDCAHLMFSNVRALGFTGLFASHPPLDQRIRRIAPAWDGSYLPVERAPAQTQPPLPAARKQAPQTLFATAAGSLMRILDQVGLPDATRLQAAQAWIEGLPVPLSDAARDATGAQALVYRLLLHAEGEALAAQRGILAKYEEKHLLEALARLEAAVPAIPVADRLPLLDLAIPTLRGLEPGRLKAFWQTIRDLTEADGTVDLFEYALRRITVAALEPEAEARARPHARVYIGEAQVEVNILLSVLARVGAASPEQAEASFQAAREHFLGFHAGMELRLLPNEVCTLQALDAACDKLARLAPAFQQRLVLAGLAAVSVDGVLRPEELEAFRAVAAALGVPVPPGLHVKD